MDISTLTSALVATTRSASALAAEDLPFHRSLSSSLASSLDRQNARLLALSERLLGAAAPHPQAVRPRLRDIEAVDGDWRAIVDVLDSLLERADTALDEFTGAVRRLSPGAVEQMQRVNEKQRRTGWDWRTREKDGGEIEKPQSLFEHPPTNDETGFFVPLLETKPHAIQSLSEGVEGGHPYQKEIEEYQYPSDVYTEAEPIPYHDFASTTATFVDTEEAMYEMLEELKQAKEVAVDLEHHDLRSYIGIVCLMQISTRDRDWIVDTLKPWRRKLQCLNEVFANPNILKVLHGAYMDVMWLQRDLGLYLVGLFDTHYASRALGYPGGSLAFLLKKFANVDAQKQYQTADWRIRPLPEELFDYARSDTHYLLYIFDNMRNELIQRSDFSKPDHEGDKLWDVLQRSSETALQRYEHPVYDMELGQGAAGWYKMLARTSASLTKEQFSVFRAVHKWRDDVAREQDDSVHYVMANHQIFTLAKSMPATIADLLSMANTQTVRLRAHELLGIIAQAKEDGKDGPEMMDLLNRIEPPSARRPVVKEVPAHSVAAFLPKSSPQHSNEVNSLPLRTNTSALWGATWAWQGQQRGFSSAPEVTLSVPLPPLTTEGFADEEVALPSTPVEPSSEATPMKASADDVENDDVFVLKQLNKKRKRQEHAYEPYDGMAAQSDEVSIDNIPDDVHTRDEAMKRAQRAAKKAAKRAKKTLSEGAVNGTTADAGEEPFDYASAPSMLNPMINVDGGKEKIKPTNLYAKALDTKKGLPRSQREKAGRSMTYKS